LSRVLVVALNPALDITHELARVDWAGVNRPAVVLERPGGKGLNVARTLLALGADVLVTGLAGGRTGDAVRSALAGTGVPARFTPIAGETRRTFAVVDAGRGQTALFSEPGPEVSAAEYARFRDGYRAGLAGSAAVVLTGSLPRGVAGDSYAALVRAAAAAGVPVLLDADGAALRHGVAAGPDVVKPNQAELAAAVPATAVPATAVPATAADDDGVAWSAVAAQELRAAGARAVVVSLGAAGLLAVTAEGSWRATPPHRVAGNPTGAGDAVVAGLAHLLVLGRPWPERLRHAVALGAAAAAAPAAGEFRTADYQEALAGASVTRIKEA
jgi:tagatose 6-phosphate kinase